MIKNKELDQYAEEITRLVRNLEIALPPEFRYLSEQCARQIEERKPAPTYHKWGTVQPTRTAKCPECGLVRSVRTQIGWNFCPCCGAEFGGIN